MSVVIEFPNKEQLSSKKSEKWIRDTLARTELTAEETDEVVSEYKGILQDLNPHYRSVMRLRGDLELSEEQLKAIKTAHDDCVKGIFEHFLKQLAHTQSIILGLLAAEKLSG